MTANELREKYLNFFKERDHAIIPSASLIPEHDPTVLFTTAGMHPLTSFLLGEKHPGGKRLVNVQKCIRTGDIDDVGDSWHLTFFEMLGNWSLGDYWKKEAIEWSFEFLTGRDYLGISSEKLSVTVFAGDPSINSGQATRDEESAKIWESLGIPKERIFYLSKEENWWGPAGQTGPCGPCSEMFYDTGKEKCGSDCKPGCKCGKYAEIWNDVFMEFNKTAEGKFEQLKQKNVDTGMGVERTIAVLDGFDNVYDTELFKPLIKKIEEISNKKYEGENIKTFRIIADHLKAATFILAEGVEPSNVERGYVLRRLIRRAVRYGKQLGINDIFTFKIANVVIEMYRDVYLELSSNRMFIEEQLVREEEKFTKTLEKGLKVLEKMKPKKTISFLSKSFFTEYGLSGDVLFNLYSTYGFPIEMSLEEIKKLYQEYNREQGVSITELTKDDENRILQQFHESLKKHQELSRAGAEQKFKGGLADHSEHVVKYHTAAHLMLAALRQVLGSHVTQKGSNITAERLRFDFSHPQKLTLEQIKQVEDLVNQTIVRDLPVKMEEMSLDEAKEQGAMGVFESRYGEKVKVYTIAENGKIFSKEICGGPHVEKIGQLGHFKILKEESVSAGARRIKAVLE
ncbi:MAG: alanine--tRNA ligase [Parcubacteria group bacterium CG1_02_40_82]|uniref:Alanine--tRNA ligase n=2 Tax=Candidatus Portnoyibacteriota TaxID=1817913 RepID=A0A2H0KUH7_9BACT|nr:MAG: alanine--tRNA ligase [Parcubacteria group bacterium CG1_02_40_82]PIQ75074.1 MAG: alanine--tRNA ligase [Candidatus Portnoybacteria bacterium CG11_big_fil_rev_8_21_14_0_20_40_15]PIS30549.1 MAG: alanine--tRNA ligase [Candidatus Portnoybacteria bacterium CG08_land_8_20_14_0_20_40_83]PIY75373.1 MAG: alanine--tRNA ligase [Candidatus Portnoybacteria bacterium CG_4_10_14_0_8_um_filter_40_50]